MDIMEPAARLELDDPTSEHTRDTFRRRQTLIILMLLQLIDFHI